MYCPILLVLLRFQELSHDPPRMIIDNGSHDEDDFDDCDDNDGCDDRDDYDDDDDCVDYDDEDDYDDYDSLGLAL